MLSGIAGLEEPYFRKEKSTATETKQELIAGLMKHCKNELCWRYPELGRALLELRVQLDEQVTAMETDGESLYVNPEYLIQLFGENPEKVYEKYLRLIRQCLEMPERFGEKTAKQKAICKKMEGNRRRTCDYLRRRRKTKRREPRWSERRTF